MRLSSLALGILIGAVLFTTASVIIAWTGPNSAPPNGNVSAPINVGATDQVKNAGLGVNSLAVFGNAILAGVSSYLNFGTTAGSSGHGIRDNNGTMEFKNTNGSWQGMLSTSSTFSQIKFADGTTQTTAATSGIASGSLAGYCVEHSGQTFGPYVGYGGCQANVTKAPAICAVNASSPCTCASGYSVILFASSANNGGSSNTRGCIKN